MVCPFCTHTQTSVYNSRPTSKINNVWRRRRCNACHRVFTTTETVDPSSVLHIKDGKQIVPFWEIKLLLSILRACDHVDEPQATAYYITQTVEQKLYRKAAAAAQTIFKSDITQATLDALKSYNPAAYIKYLSHHAPELNTRALKKALKD